MFILMSHQEKEFSTTIHVHHASREGAVVLFFIDSSLFACYAFACE
jgi:hypothetical protein